MREMMTMSEQSTTSRRNFIKAGTVGLISLGSSSVAVQISGATELDSPELDANAYVPSEGAIRVTIDEHESEDSDEEVSTDAQGLDSGENTYTLDGLEGEEDYYDFLVEMGTDGESPELESLTLRLPVEPEELPLIDYTEEIDRARPDHVTVEYDEYLLRIFQPRLHFPDSSTRNAFNGMYGSVFRSDELENDVCCYWVLMDRGEEPPLLGNASNLGDHIPIYVFVDSSNEEVERVVYDGFHWKASEMDYSDRYFEQRRTDSPTHAKFKVVSDYHFLTRTEASGNFVSLEDWPASRQSWMDNKFYDNVDIDGVENPWEMESRDDWRGGFLNSVLASSMANVATTLGWYGGEEADDLR